MSGESLVAVVAGTASAVVGVFGVFWLYRYVDGINGRLVRRRERHSDDELIRLYADSETPVRCSPQLLIDVLQLVGESLDVEYSRLRPDDSLEVLLAQSWLAEHFRRETLEYRIGTLLHCEYTVTPQLKTLRDILNDVVSRLRASRFS